jgi:SAM-dependent methyltransferase
MLQRSPASLRRRSLVRGVAEALPFADRVFDLVLVVNALHHFENLELFVTEATRVLRPRGTLAAIGLDPSTGTDRWYVYDFFPRALELDRQRYPSAVAVRALLEQSGFEAVETEVAQHLPASEPARAYLESGALHRHTTSQLSLLTDDEFNAGLDRIWSAIQAGEANGSPLSLHADLRLYLTSGHLPEARPTGAA